MNSNSMNCPQLVFLSAFIHLKCDAYYKNVMRVLGLGIYCVNFKVFNFLNMQIAKLKIISTFQSKKQIWYQKYKNKLLCTIH